MYAVQYLVQRTVSRVSPRRAGQTPSSSSSQINRDAIVAHALTVADTDGLAAVTVRRLAHELGVTPMALYWHVSGKEDLLAAMGDRLFVGLPPDTDPAAPWQDQLHELVRALTACLRAHPNLAVLAGPRVLQNDEGRRLTERALDLLRAAGFPVEQAAEIARHALRTAISLVIEQSATRPSLDPEQRGEDLRLKQMALRELPSERFPRLVEAADTLTGCADEDAYYSFGVDLLIAGIASSAPPPPPRKRHEGL